MDAVTVVPEPANEPVHSYAPGTPERASLVARLEELRGEHVELTQTIGGRHRMASGERFAVVEPHRHASVLGTAANATDADVAEAVIAAKAAAARRLMDHRAHFAARRRRAGRVHIHDA